MPSEFVVAVKRVLIVLDIAVGSTTAHVRGRRFADDFAQHGWQAEFVDVADRSIDEIVEQARGFPVVYLVKVRSLELLRQLRMQTRARLVFDLTDALWEHHHRRGWANVELLVAEADVVFSENTFVCDFARRLNDRVVSIPVCTQVELFEQTRKTEPELLRRDDHVTIGWIGSPTTVRALERVRRPLEQLCATRPQVRVRFLGVGNATFDDWRAPVSSVPAYDEPTMIREILQMDIGLYPPPESLHDYAIRGAQKAMLYMTGGAVPICQNAGDCTRIVRHEVSGMLVASESEWSAALAKLVDDRSARNDMAQAAMQQMLPYTRAAVFAVLERELLAAQVGPRSNRIARKYFRATVEKRARDLRFKAVDLALRAQRRVSRKLGL